MRAKIHLEGALKQVLGDFGWDWPEKAVIEPPKDKSFGDMSANVAMMLSKQAKKAPRAIAEDIQGALSGDPLIEKIDIAGPGFLNFTFAPTFWQETVGVILEAGEEYGSSTLGNGTKVQVEYVSANPHRAAAHRSRSRCGSGRLPDPDSREGRVRGRGRILHQ